MSHDPFRERETEKYENPIPSREFILAHLDKREKPASREELAQELEVNGEEQIEALRRRLRAMERDGQLVFTRRQCYALPERLDLLKGKVIGHRDGFGFLRIEGSKDDLYLSAEQMKMCIHGDIILAQAMGADRRGRREARVVRVVEPRNAQIVARYFMDSGVGFVVPDDSRLSFDILIPSEALMGARMGYVVVVELVQRPTRRSKAIGKVVEVLGDNMGTSMAIDMALRTHEIPHEWSETLKKQIANLSEEVPEEAKHGRVDLRDLPLITIDGEDARDFDDAVFCQRKRGGGWRLWIAIADVSYYVRPNTPLDDEACKRGTTIYFPSQVVPMLPEVLSNGLCSLNPEVDRLCMVCEMTISSTGKLTSYKHYEAVMNSFARLTYNEVWDILQGNQKLRQQYEPLAKDLEELHRMYLVLEKFREQRGGISFETEEAKFIFNADRRIERVEKTSRNDAHKMIEECMILANIASARYIEKNNKPALFRDHDRPSNDSIKDFRSVLNELGLTLSGGDKPQPLDYSELLSQIVGRSDYEMLQTMLLRSMKQAVYDPENRGHFGLALVSYTHFTSPIRRYPDLLLHRTIKYLLAKEASILQGSDSTPTGGFHYEMPRMRQLGQHCSMTERRADEATRDVVDWLKCDFMQDQVGGTFNGVISSVTGFGFFVRLTDLFIDGLVHVSTLDNDYYRFDSVGQRLIGESSGHTYRLGDTIEVRVDAVHIDERKIDFALISSKHKPRGEGKTELRREKHGTNKKSGSRHHAPQKRANFKSNSAFRTEKIAQCIPEVATKKKELRRPLDKIHKIGGPGRIKRVKKINEA